MTPPFLGVLTTAAWPHLAQPTPYIIIMSTLVSNKATPRSRKIRRFPPEKFITIPGVVVFAEHATHLRDGTPVNYDREALEKIAACCNRQVKGIGNDAAVCIASYRSQQWFRVKRWNRSIRSRVIGPGFPVPMGRLSTFTTGTISAAVPVRKHSSAI